MRLRGWLLVGVIGGVCGLGGIAEADRADQLFKKGKKLLAEKKYLEACAAFEESDRLEPGIGAKLNVAKCFQEWGKLATAWRWYSDAEQMAKDTKDDRAKKIRELAEELDASVPRLTVKAPRDANTTGVTIKLDGAVLEAGALGTAQRVDPGPHQVDYVIDGTKQTKVVPVERGGTSEVVLDLPSTSNVVQPTAEPTARADEDPGRTSRLLGLGLTGAGAVAMGIAGIVAIGARGDYKDALTAHCRGAKNMCDAGGLTATHDARHRANIATLVTLGGVAAVAGGLLLYVTAPGAARGGEHALYLAPSIGEDGDGVVFGGAF